MNASKLFLALHNLNNLESLEAFRPYMDLVLAYFEESLWKMDNITDYLICQIEKMRETTWFIAKTM